MPTISPDARGQRGLHSVVLAATVVIGLSSTMLAIALPRASADLSGGALASTWMLLSYQVVTGALLVLGGQVSDAFDARRMFRLGLFAFTAAGLGLVAAPSSGVFVVARGVQGLGGALLLSTCVVLLTSAHPPGRERTSAIALYLAGFTMAQVVGPILGGIVTEAVGWRWLFVLTTVIGAAALVVGWRTIGRVPVRVEQSGVDLPGNLVLAAMMTTSMIGVSGAQVDGWTSPRTLGLLGASVLLLPVLVAVERRQRHPAVAVELMRDRPFALACLGSFLLSGPRIAPAMLLSLFLQGFAGENPTTAALTITTLPLAATVGVFAGGRLAGGARAVRMASLVAALSCVGALALLAAIALGGQRVLLVLGLVALGLGSGAFQTINAAMILELSPAGAVGTVNGLRVLTQQAGIALAMGVLVSLGASQVAAADAPAYFAGKAELLSPAAREAIRSGHVVALSVLLAVCVAALVANVVLERQVDRRVSPDGGCDPSTPTTW